MHVDRTEPAVEREVHVREGEDDVCPDEEAVRLGVEPRRRPLVDVEQADDEDDRRDHERHERHEPDHRAQARQLEVHPVDRRDEQHERHEDRLQREDERRLDRLPELRVVDDRPVVLERAAGAGLVRPEAEDQGRDQRDQEVGGPEQEPQHGRRRDEPARRQRDHLEARRWSGM